MKRLHVRHKISSGETHNASDKESLVLIKSNTVKLEELIEVAAPNGVFLSKIVVIDVSSLQFEVIEKQHQVPTSKGELVLIQPILKQKRMRYVIEKASEIGYDKLIPVITHYSDSTIKRTQKMKKHWYQVAKDAQKQSLRSEMLKINEPIRFKDLVFIDHNTQICLATENVDKTSLKSLFNTIELRENNKILVLVGPEKGWHIDEIELMKNGGVHFVGLEGNILRSETAGLVVGSIIKYHLDQL